MTLIWNKYW